jgi:Mg/Co/Ni transporter MgtE
VVAVALPVVSMWANLLGGLFPMVAVKLGCVPPPQSLQQREREDLRR